MKPMPWIFVVVFVACASLVACGSSSSSSQPSGDDSGSIANDAGDDTSPTTDAPIDDAAQSDADASGPSDVYPAPHPPLPTSKSHGGDVVAHPKIVPVVFDVDPLEKDIEAFVGAW